MEHAPLTSADRDFLDALAANPVEMTVPEQMANPASINFLLQLGYLKAEQTYLDPDPAKNRFRFTRTDKPLP